MEIDDTHNKLELDNSSFRIRGLPNYRIKPQWFDITTARLLSLIDDFYQDIQNTRQEMDLAGETIDYPEDDFIGIPFDEDGIVPSHFYIILKWSIEAMSKASGTDETIIRENLEKSSDKILDKYKLTHRWRFPLEILLLTDVLILPLDSPVYVGAPVMHGGVMDLIGDSLEVMTSRAINPKRFVRIVITEQMSLEELTRHLKSDETFKYGIEQLPRAIKPGLKGNALYWGHLAWAEKHFSKTELSWSDVVGKLTELKPKEDVPDRAALSVYYKRFMEAKSDYM